jgi:hypothetical protein
MRKENGNLIWPHQLCMCLDFHRLGSTNCQFVGYEHPPLWFGCKARLKCRVFVLGSFVIRLWTEYYIYFQKSKEYHCLPALRQEVKTKFPLVKSKKEKSERWDFHCIMELHCKKKIAIVIVTHNMLEVGWIFRGRQGPGLSFIPSFIFPERLQTLLLHIFSLLPPVQPL